MLSAYFYNRSCFLCVLVVLSHLRQLNKNKVAESLDFTGVMPLFMFKRMLYGNTTLKFF